jgi:hypothetical protein
MDRLAVRAQIPIETRRHVNEEKDATWAERPTDLWHLWHTRVITTIPTPPPLRVTGRIFVSHITSVVTRERRLPNMSHHSDELVIERIVRMLEGDRHLCCCRSLLTSLLFCTFERSVVLLIELSIGRADVITHETAQIVPRVEIGALRAIPLQILSSFSLHDTGSWLNNSLWRNLMVRSRCRLEVIVKMIRPMGLALRLVIEMRQRRRQRRVGGQQREGCG